jgi:hypothetical protein
VHSSRNKEGTETQHSGLSRAIRLQLASMRPRGMREIGRGYPLTSWSCTFQSPSGFLSLRADGAEHCIGIERCAENAIAPGVVETEMSNFAKTDAGRELALGMQALKRIGQPDDIGDVVAFLASDEARWITGETVRVDGGSKL